MNCYIHIPFCASKCGYCAFYSEVCQNATLHTRFLEHLATQLYNVPADRVDTVYVGGGTPTLLDDANLQRLIRLIKDNFNLAADAEISIEANPETLTAEKVALLRTFFTRISVGVQSFNAEFRHRIGRKCSDEALCQALDLIRKAKFQHWNCDLIYSLPGQTVDDWQQDLTLAAECGADHISCYSLTPEENAALGAAFAVDDEREEKMFFLAEKILAKYGIYRYEISNYARSGCECRHNLNVWRGGLLRGFGPSAADFDGRTRHIECASLEKWLAGGAPEVDELAPAARCNEIFAVNLRTCAGWTPQLWEQVPQHDSWANRLKIAEKLQKTFPGALTVTPERIKLSAQGLLYWNNIAEEII